MNGQIKTKLLLNTGCYNHRKLQIRKKRRENKRRENKKINCFYINKLIMITTEDYLYLNQNQKI